MAEHVTPSQASLESNASGTMEASQSNEGTVDNRISACEKLLGVKAGEAIDYIDEFNQHVAIRCSKARQSNSPPHESSGSSHSVKAQEDRDRAVEEAAWATLCSRLKVPAPTQPGPSTNVLDKVFELPAQESSPPSLLSKSVLAVASHLPDDGDTVFEDSYLNETYKCKVAYANQKPFENLVIKAQGRKVQEPIVNSIWRLVILHKYVDVEKLFATLDPDYNPNDDAKDLTDKFILLEKHTISSRCQVSTEAEWLCLYDLWVYAVLHFYPHCKVELVSYRELIINMF